MYLHFHPIVEKLGIIKFQNTESIQKASSNFDYDLTHLITCAQMKTVKY